METLPAAHVVAYAPTIHPDAIRTQRFYQVVGVPGLSSILSSHSAHTSSLSSPGAVQVQPPSPHPLPELYAGAGPVRIPAPSFLIPAIASRRHSGQPPPPAPSTRTRWRSLASSPPPNLSRGGARPYESPPRL
jgi:hypothetical protein